MLKIEFFFNCFPIARGEAGGVVVVVAVALIAVVVVVGWSEYAEFAAIGIAVGVVAGAGVVGVVAAVDIRSLCLHFFILGFPVGVAAATADFRVVAGGVDGIGEVGTGTGDD